MLTEILSKERTNISLEIHFIFNPILETFLINGKQKRSGIIGYFFPYKSVEYELPMEICSAFDNIDTKGWILINENIRIHFHLI